MDLGAPARIEALQVNFAEQDARAFGRAEPMFHRYVVETSDDGRRWSTLVDKSRDTTDVPHDYVVLDDAVRARHVRITNVHMPAGGRFALRDLRVFGLADGPAPQPVRELAVRRDPADARTATLRWQRVSGATGYVVRYGLSREKLYANHQVGDVDSLTTNALNRDAVYYFTVDAINASGITRGGVLRAAPTSGGRP